MTWLTAIGRGLGYPFRACGAACRFLIDLTPGQMKSLLTLAMIGGIVAISGQNVWYLFMAKAALHAHGHKEFFDLVTEQMKFNSYLQAWFAFIMGMIVFGADYVRAKFLGHELGLGRGGIEPPPAPAPPKGPVG